MEIRDKIWEIIATVYNFGSNEYENDIKVKDVATDRIMKLIEEDRLLASAMHLDGKKPWRPTEDLLSGEMTEDVCKVFMDWLGDPTKPASFELKTSIYIAVQGRFERGVEIL